MHVMNSYYKSMAIKQLDMFMQCSNASGSVQL